MTLTEAGARGEARARDEAPVFFPSGDEELFGILTRPTVTPNGMTVVHLTGKGPSASTVGRGRVSVFLARKLAAHGFHSFRFDYRGIGESTGEPREWSLGNVLSDELQAGMSWLRAQGLADVILLGTCGGGRIALQAGPRASGVRGVVLLNTPVRDYDKTERFESLPASVIAKRLLSRKTLADLRDRDRRRRYWGRARRKLAHTLRRLRRGRGSGAGGGAERTDGIQWISPKALNSLHELVTKQVPVLFYYGADDQDYHDYVAATKGPLGPLLAEAGDLIKVTVVPGRYYDTPSQELYDSITEAIAGWMRATSTGRPS